MRRNSFLTGEGVRTLGRKRTPHPARTAQSRCDGSAISKNGGRRPPFCHLLPQGEKGRKKPSDDSLICRTSVPYSNASLHSPACSFRGSGNSSLAPGLT